MLISCYNWEKGGGGGGGGGKVKRNPFNVRRTGELPIILILTVWICYIGLPAIESFYFILYIGALQHNSSCHGSFNSEHVYACRMF